MGDRIAILNGGRLQQVSTPLECYHEPANQFVAGFLGEPSMNFFDVRFENGTLVGDGFEYPVGPDVGTSLRGRTDVVLGIRPEDIELAERASSGHDFETTVDVVEPMGDENTVHLRFDEGAETLIATASGFTRISAGDEVIARFPEDAIHVFDRESGEALHNRSLESDTLSVELS